MKKGKTKIINIIDSTTNLVIATLKVDNSLKAENIMKILNNTSLDASTNWLNEFKAGDMLGKQVDSENYFI